MKKFIKDWLGITDYKPQAPEYTPPKFRIARVAWEVYHTLLVIGVWALFVVQLLAYLGI